MEGIRLFSTQRKKHVSCRMITSSKKVDDARKTYDSHKGRFLEAYEEVVAALNKFDGDFMDEMLELYEHDPSMIIIIIPKIQKKLFEAIEKIFAALNEFHNLFSMLNRFHTMSVEEKVNLCLLEPSKMSILAEAKEKLFGFLNEFHKGDPLDMLKLAAGFAGLGVDALLAGLGFDADSGSPSDSVGTLHKRHVIDKYVSKWRSHPLFNCYATRKEANTQRSTLSQIEFDKAIGKLLKKHHAINKEAIKPLSTLQQIDLEKAIGKLLKKFYAVHGEANTQGSTLQQVEFDKAIRKLLKKCHAIHKEGNKPLSTPQQIEFEKAVCKLLKIGHAIHKEANKPLSTPLGSTVQQMHTTPAPGVPYDDGHRVPPSTQMPMALPSNDPASVGGSSDDDPNDIENPRDEPSSSTEASPEHPLDITRSSNGASLPVREDGSERREPPVPHGNRDLEAMHNRAIPKEVLLMFALQVTQILFTESRDINLLSREAKILQYCAEAITGIGIFCGLGVVSLRNRPNVQGTTEIMSAIGFFSTALGFIATMCVPLPKESMFWILGCISFPFSAVFAYLLWKRWIF